MPTPTPPYSAIVRSAAPIAVSRASTCVDTKTSANALATPEAKRSAIHAASPSVAAIAASVATVAASPARASTDCAAGPWIREAAIAPTR